MKRSYAAWPSVVVLCAALYAPGGTDYPIPAAVKAANKAKVEAYKSAAYWKDAPFACCAVNAMSGIRRTPDLFPADGKFTNPVRIVAAQGEFEPGSFLLFPFKSLPSVSLEVGDLTSGSAKIPASAIDLTTVKIWYQGGTAWSGFHSDPLRRIPTPELMLHDENLIKVDHDLQENWLRCDYRGGRTDYRWISFTPQAGDYQYVGEVRNHWIHDAEAMQPVALQEGAFKQFIATIKVPENAESGIYTGEIAASVDGKRVLGIPLEVRVLPFTLPVPATFRDLNREFYGSIFPGGLSLATSPKVVKNLVDHNVKNPLLQPIPNERTAKNFFTTAVAGGLSTNRLFAIMPSAGLRTSYPVQESDANYLKFCATRILASNTLARIRDNCGPNALAYSYGIDEASASGVRAQRSTWQMFHKLGSKIMTTTTYHPYLLFNLDFALFSRQPSPSRKLNADMIHAANPDALVGWYADPHSGPENPAYARRLYGWTTWRNNYDMSCQYILYRDDWTEFWIAKEPFLRGLMLCYPQDGDILDTLAWEGLREGMDDVRYGTLLHQYAARAAASDDMDTVYLGRAAGTWLAQVDADRSGLDSLRLEMISRILTLKGRLDMEGK